MGLLLGQSIPFLHPGIAAGAVLASVIPILIHVINRRRHRRIPWAAMTFLLAANRRSLRRIRLEQWLLMLLRVAAILLLGLGIARPYLSASSWIRPSSTPMHRILVLDNSLSMRAESSPGRTRFESAMECAGQLIGSFAERDVVSVVTMATPAEQIVLRGLAEGKSLRDRLATIQATQSTTDLAGAADLVLELLQSSSNPKANHAVYIISDWQQSGPGKEGEEPGPIDLSSVQRVADALTNPGETLHLVGVETGRSDNLAVSGLEVEPPVGLFLPVRAKVTVTNYGESAARDAWLQIRKDGSIIRKQVLPRIEPGTSGRATLSLEFSSPGTHVLEARLQTSVADALSDDDVRSLSVEIREATRVLLVDGGSDPRPFRGQCDYLAAAFGTRLDRPSMRGRHEWEARTFLTTRVIPRSELEGEVLSEHDVIVLCNVGTLSASNWQALREFVQAGGGLMIFLGDQVEPENYVTLGTGDVGPLPARLQSSSVQPVEAVTLASERLRHPVVADFRDHERSGLFLARYERYWPVEPIGAAEVVLRYSDGAPAVLAGGVGSGRTLLFTSTADMEWNNLPGKGDYVSLMLSAVFHVAPSFGEHRNVSVGQSISEALTAQESSMALRARTATETLTPSLRAGGRGLVAEVGPMKHSGVVTLEAGGRERHFAVNVNTAESNLKRVGVPGLLKSLDRPARFLEAGEVAEGPPARPAAAEFGGGLLYVVIGLLLLEPWLAMVISGGGVRGSESGNGAGD